MWKGGVIQCHQVRLLCTPHGEASTNSDERFVIEQHSRVAETNIFVELLDCFPPRKVDADAASCGYSTTTTTTTT